MKILRDYQHSLMSEVFGAWHAGFRNVLAVMATGAGKTATMAALFHHYNAVSCAIVHRQELVAQISCAFADEGLYHRIIGPPKVRQFIIKQHIKQFGRSFIDDKSPIAVAGVDTLIRRVKELEQFAASCRLWSGDEAHHFLRENKWGTAVEMFPNAYGVGWTATPERADKKGLGATKSGVFHHMVFGPDLQWLIDRGFLAKYKIYGIPPAYVIEEEDISKNTGDVKESVLRKKAHASQIVGDMTRSYLEYGPGKLGLTFTVDIELAKEQAAAYRHFGVPAEALSGETPDDIRQTTMDKLRRGDIKQIVNVDLFGEGLDCPGIEIVSDGRRTESYSRYSQVFGRMIRASPGKEYGIYLDHVGNVIRHNGAPVRHRDWSLDDEGAPKKKNDLGEVPTIYCTACKEPYERIHNKCPWCGHKEVPLSRSAPEHVDGDLLEYDEEFLAKLRGDVIDLNRNTDYRVSDARSAAMRNNLRATIETQQELRDCIAYWAGIEKSDGFTDSQSYRKFYHKFGMDVMAAQALEPERARKLINMIRSDWV